MIVPLRAGANVLPKSAIRTWPEYSYLGDGDVLFTIEYCSQCWKHEHLSHHNEDKYIQVSIHGDPNVLAKQEFFFIFNPGLK